VLLAAAIAIAQNPRQFAMAPARPETASRCSAGTGRFGIPRGRWGGFMWSAQQCICMARRTSWSHHVPLPAKLAAPDLFIDNQVRPAVCKKKCFFPEDFDAASISLV
jgi:hypothetical protein